MKFLHSVSSKNAKKLKCILASIGSHYIVLHNRPMCPCFGFQKFKDSSSQRILSALKTTRVQTSSQCMEEIWGSMSYNRLIRINQLASSVQFSFWEPMHDAHQNYLVWPRWPVEMTLPLYSAWTSGCASDTSLFIMAFCAISPNLHARKLNRGTKSLSHSNR